MQVSCMPRPLRACTWRERGTVILPWARSVYDGEASGEREEGEEVIESVHSEGAVSRPSSPCGCMEVPVACRLVTLLQVIPVLALLLLPLVGQAGPCIVKVSCSWSRPPNGGSCVSCCSWLTCSELLSSGSRNTTLGPGTHTGVAGAACEGADDAGCAWAADLSDANGVGIGACSSAC